MKSWRQPLSLLAPRCLILTKSIQIFSIFTGQELHELGLQSILNSLRPRLKAQMITIANKMKKNYVDKSYMNTQFRFGYFHRLALPKLKNYSLTIFYNIHWSLNTRDEASEWTPDVESKLIMVIFVHFIRCLRPGINCTPLYS